MLVILPSITTAIRVQKILAAKGIESQRIHSTKSPEIPQCGHGLKIAPENLDAVRDAVSKTGSKIKAVVKL
ncbi:MAG: DUF3343 domain-containing protein [Clostridia bacterium]|nr:DUF3343 domain-containing protein [Clostridia bacterium]